MDNLLGENDRSAHTRTKLDFQEKSMLPNLSPYQKKQAEIVTLSKANKELVEALKPLANLDLTGCNGDTVYQRGATYIRKADVLRAKELLTKLNAE